MSYSVLSRLAGLLLEAMLGGLGQAGDGVELMVGQPGDGKGGQDT